MFVDRDQKKPTIALQKDKKKIGYIVLESKTIVGVWIAMVACMVYFGW